MENIVLPKQKHSRLLEIWIDAQPGAKFAEVAQDAFGIASKTQARTYFVHESVVYYQDPGSHIARCLGAVARKSTTMLDLTIPVVPLSISGTIEVSLHTERPSSGPGTDVSYRGYTRFKTHLDPEEDGSSKI